MEWAHRIQTQTDIAYGPFPLQRLDLTLQIRRVGEPVFNQPLDEPRPLLVWYHGGGWIQGDKSTQWNQIVPYLARGWHVANVNYRQGPGTAPVAVEDCLLALRWLAEHAAELSLAYDRIVVSGASAGGHLALATGLISRHPDHAEQHLDGVPVDSIVNWYGITDIGRVAEHLDAHRPGGNYARTWVGGGDMEAVSARFSPVHLLSDAAPSILSIQGDSDSLVPHDQAIALHERLDEAALPARLLSLPGGNHGGFIDAQYQEAFAAIFEFLN